MKKLFKITALIMVLAMALCCFAACGNNTANNVENDAETAYAGTYETLKMGTNAAFPPYEYKEGEEIIGIDAEIAAAIAKELGANFEIVDMEFDSIITAVQQGGVDFGMAGMTVTEERKLEVDFTSSYATGIQVVIVNEDSDIASIDDLAGKKIGVQLGTTGDIYATGDYGEENVIQYGKGADAVIALKGGDVDAVIIDNEPAKAFVASNEGLKILETEYAVEDYAIAIKKGNQQLLDDINAALKKLSKDGTIDGIIEKYIPAE